MIDSNSYAPCIDERKWALIKITFNLLEREVLK